MYSQLAGQAAAPIATFPVGCPAACVAPAGSCTQPGTVCVCAEGYYGWDCGAQCNCDGHGSCDSGGTCVCDRGWANCNGTDNCSTNVSSDPYNCGGCGVTCLPDPGHGVVSATCTNATCVVVCGAGYTLCPDGTCHPGSDCPLPGCNTFDDNQCSGNETDTPAVYGNRTWQTPAPGSAGYYPSFQSYATLTGYARVTYDPTRTVANVTIVTQQKTPSALTFAFNNATQTAPTATFCATAGSAPGCTATSGPVWVVVSGADGSRLELDEVYLLWGAAPLAARAGDYRGGQKGAVVELFGWPYADVAAECADLATFGYMGAKLYPVTEHVMSWQPFQQVLNPWFDLYQPVSYRLQSRMGSSADLANLITACRSVGVRVYADAVINHMVGGGSDSNNAHRNAGGGDSCTTWGAKNSSAMLWYDPDTSPRSVSPFYTQDFCYEPNANSGLPPSQEFPAAGYGPLDFHCERPLNRCVGAGGTGDSGERGRADGDAQRVRA